MSQTRSWRGPFRGGFGREGRAQQGVVARRVPVPVVGRRRPGAARDATGIRAGSDRMRRQAAAMACGSRGSTRSRCRRSRRCRSARRCRSRRGAGPPPRLQQRQAEGLVEGRIDKQPTPGAGLGVDRRHVLRAVGLRVGDAAVEVVAVDEDEEVGASSRPCLRRARRCPPACPRRGRGSARCAGPGSPVGPHQGREVLARHRPGQRQEGRLAGVVEEETVDRRLDPGLGLGRSEAGEVAARRQHADVAGIVSRVARILHLGLVPGRGDDEARLDKRRLSVAIGGGEVGAGPALPAIAAFTRPSEWAVNTKGMPSRASTRAATAAASA